MLHGEMEAPPSTAPLLAAGIAHHNAGRLDEAAAAYRQVLASEPGSAEAHHLLGVAALQSQRHSDAVQSFSRAIALDEGQARYHHNLGEALLGMKRAAEALASYRRAVAIDPGFAIGHQRLGALLYDRGALEEASAVFEQAHALRPDLAAPLANLGNIHFRTGRHEAAVDFYRRALALDPTAVDVHCNLALALGDLGELDAGIGHCRRALGLVPDHGDAHNNLGLILLLKGDYREAWPHHEWRLRMSGMTPEVAGLARRRWRGEALGGARILLHAEQGMGDTIQFVRYASLVAKMGGRVWVAAPTVLHRLLRSLSGIAEITDRVDAAAEIPWQCPLPSLPFVFGTTLATIPGTMPYLAAPAADVARWQTQVARAEGMRVGIVWAGNPDHRRDRDRSLALHQMLAPLADIPGVAFYSLQKGRAAAEAASLDGSVAVHAMGEMLGDFADTAAAIGCLDLVVTVDTSVAHLAGAMAKPVWVLLPHVPDWRWGREGDASPWYPTARLFRQPAAGDWDGALARLASELAALAAPMRANRAG